jgi:hypothetical protein
LHLHLRFGGCNTKDCARRKNCEAKDFHGCPESYRIRLRKGGPPLRAGLLYWLLVQVQSQQSQQSQQLPEQLAQQSQQSQHALPFLIPNADKNAWIIL